MSPEKIQRINQLAAKSRTAEGLTDCEKQEQRLLREEYISEWRRAVQDTLDNTYVADEHGEHKLKRKDGK